MRLQQICNLQPLYDRHVIRRALFKKHSSPILSIVLNFVVLLSVLFFVIFFFFSFCQFFVNYDSFFEALSICCKLSISSCFFLSVFKECDFFSNKNDFLESLPVSKAERLFALQISIYKSEIFLSLFFFLSLAISIQSFDLTNVLIMIICTVISPLIAIPFSVVVGYILSYTHRIRKIAIKKEPHKEFNLKAFLLKCEIKNLLRFPSLIMELVFQVIFYGIVVVISIFNPKFISLFLVYNSLSSINSTSFSREGRMFDFLRSLPLNNKDRFLPKILINLLYSLPLLFLCLFIVSFKSASYHILFYSIPFTLSIINITVTGLRKGAENPTVEWVNHQDALQINYSSLASCLAISLATIIVLFNPFNESQVFNIIVLTLINIFILVYNFLKLPSTH